MVRVEVPADEAELAADLLWAAGASAVGESPLVGRPGAVVLTADLDTCPPAIAGRWPCATEVDDGAWWDGWRPFARAARAGAFVVRPPWVERPPSDGAKPAIDLVVDAGRSFGTGSHPSTLLALEVVAELVSPGTSVLDVGCGSGILAIGATLVGAAPVVAVDVDPEAVAATTANAAANGVADRIEVCERSIDELLGTFDLVLANLGSPLVVELAPAIAAHAAPGGTIVLSGMLDERWEHVGPAYPSCSVVATPSRDGWRAVVLGTAHVDG